MIGKKFSNDRLQARAANALCRQDFAAGVSGISVNRIEFMRANYIATPLHLVKYVANSHTLHPRGKTTS